MPTPSGSLPQKPVFPETNNSDEIDLAELWAVLYKRKVLIFVFATGLAILVALYSLTLPNRYIVSALLAPTSSESGGGLSSQYSSLASLAGVSLPNGKVDDTQTYLAVMQSRKFLREFIIENQLKKKIFFKQWDDEESKWKQPFSLIGTLNGWFGFDKKTYKQQEKLETGEPTNWAAVQAFSSMLLVVQHKDSGMVTVSIEWVDPLQAREWVSDLIARINTQVRLEQIEESRKTIDYLKDQVKQTQLVEIKTAAYNLIQQNLKNMTLAKTQQNFVFKIIDPPVIPDYKSTPKRVVMVIVAFILGGLLGGFIVLIQSRRRNSTKLLVKKYNQVNDV